MEMKYMVKWDFEYVSENCDNIDYFETEEQAKDFIDRNKKYCPVFVACLWKFNNDKYERIYH